MTNQIEDIKTSEIAPQSKEDLKCAPGMHFEDGSCIRLPVLMDVANAYNTDDVNKNKIKMYAGYEMINPKKYKRYILKEIRKRIGHKCKSQRCWTEQSFIKYMNKSLKDELVNDTFRPEGPEGKFEWLNTININEVMEQYENKYKDFKFLGAVPIDFDDLDSLGIKNLDLKKLHETGKTRLGIVFNLDEHYKSGSHWVAMYTDMKEGTIFFFDSYGIVPEDRIRKLIRRIGKFYQTGLGHKKIRADYNKIRHQYENSECGVYSINFILRLLRGDKFEDICNNKVPDKVINKCRNTYFSK